MQFSIPARGGPFWPFGTRQGSRNFEPLRRCGPLTFSPVIYGGFGCFISPRGFCLMPKPENLMPNLEAKFWTIATAVWTTVTAFWKLEDTHPKKSVLEVLKLGPKKKIFQNGQKKNLED